MKTYHQLITEIKSYLIEAPLGVAFTFGRLNPPTRGHEKLIDKVINIAKKNNVEPRIFLSKSEDNKKNPLKFDEKVKFLQKIFRKVTFANDKTIRTPFEVLERLNDQNISKVIMIVGADRVSEFKTNMQRFIDKDLPNIKSFNVVSAGDRDPDAEGVEGISASKMREFAKQDDFKKFLQGLPTQTNLGIGEKIFNAVKKGLGIK